MSVGLRTDSRHRDPRTFLTVTWKNLKQTRQRAPQKLRPARFSWMLKVYSLCQIVERESPHPYRTATFFPNHAASLVTTNLPIANTCCDEEQSEELEKKAPLRDACSYPSRPRTSSHQQRPLRQAQPSNVGPRWKRRIHLPSPQYFRGEGLGVRGMTRPTIPLFFRLFGQEFPYTDSSHVRSPGKPLTPCPSPRKYRGEGRSCSSIPL